MTKEELIKRLEEQQKKGDTEEAHYVADNLLLEYIDDEDIAEAFGAVEKWYA